MVGQRINCMEGATRQWVYIRDLKVHPDVQRKFQLSHAKKLLAEFDPARLDPLKVVRENGELLVYEGQHRLWALIQWLGGEERANGQQIEVYVRDAAPDKLLAKERLASDSQLRMVPVDRFRMLVLSEDPIAVAVASTLAQYGLVIGQGPGDNIV